MNGASFPRGLLVKGTVAASLLLLAYASDAQPTDQPPPGGPGVGGPGAPPGGPGGPTFGGNATVGVGVTGPGMPPGGQPPPPVDDEEERAMALAEEISLTGSTGLLHTAYAGSSPSQFFRVGFMFDWFTTGGFLCNGDTPCNPDGSEDDHSHVGAFFALNATPFSFLEAYAGIRTYANSNNMGSPQLLQVLGDTTLGLKVFTPFRIGNNLTVGGDFRLLLLNGAGDVGVSGGGTSAEFMALATSDFRKIKGKGIGAPVRVHLNLGYRIDNSGELVSDVESLRAERDPDTAGDLERIPISRIERYGLGINRVDFFQIKLGLDVPFRWIQPFVEYNVDIPVNRQGYECHTRTISPGDVCLALADPELADPGFGGISYSGVPSRLSIGARTNPLFDAFRGLSAMLAFDIGLSATSTFVEEIAPQAPWTLYFGLAYSFDTKKKEPKIIQSPPLPTPTPVPLPPPPQYFVRGQVVEQGGSQPVANAIITVEGSPEPPVATGSDGRFLTREVTPTLINLAIEAPGYKPGKCSVTVNAGGGLPPVADQPPMIGPDGLPMPAPAPMPMPPQGGASGPQYTEVQCELEALPKDGGVQGTTKDTDSGASVVGVTIELTDAAGQTHNTTSGPDGSFQFPKLPLGTVTIKAQHNDYMLSVVESQVRPREQANVLVSLNKRPKQASVKVVGDQIQVLKPIHFELNSAIIASTSFALMGEIADVMLRNPQLTKIEVQGHTDNTGTEEINRKLSQDRADSVKSWLSSHGVDGGRLVAKGYGSGRPLAPNVTPANRARNRRVQFFILEKSR
jgi:outer membrane protein OmpA-like peptidoglycan-associated protein